MTKQELIDHLQHLEQYTHYSEDAPALREVIETLKCSEMPNSSEERTQERTETHACDLISRADVEQTVEDNILCYTHSDRPIDQDPDTECHKAIRTALKMLRKDLKKLPSAQPDHSADVSKKVECPTFEDSSQYAQPEIKPIEYRDCDNAMLKMWIDKVLTDGEYNRIMDKLNAHWAERREE